MSEARVGRLLVASLHQSIGDHLPQRLDYYEHWLTPMGLKDGRSGRAALGAVLSFLRQEGRTEYDAVMTGAGRYAEEWYRADRPGPRIPIRLLPRSLQGRVALRRSRGLLNAACSTSSVTAAMKRSSGVATVSSSVFCTLREPWPWPTCQFFVEALSRDLARQGMPATVRGASCLATGSDACRFDVSFGGNGLGPGGEEDLA